jgi:hypothetical protein
MRFSVRLARGAVAALTIVLLSACTGHATGCNAIPVVNLPLMTTPTLVSPASGATGISTGPLDVTIGNAFTATSLFVKDGSGNVTTATNLRQANPPANDVRIGTFVQLASHTTYQVYAVVPSFQTQGCSPTAVTVPVNVLLGTFTTA